MKDIVDVASTLGISSSCYELYGKYKAKLDLSLINNKNSNLILVTSINPTPMGEGKTTTAIGLNDALVKLGKKSVVVLREPSLGPVFGMKGGATGGGLASVVPSDDINLHFTGDFHAITSCNNLLCAVIDNHLFQGNLLNINPDKIIFPRCVDMNDRALRNINIGIDYFERKDSFVITAASPIMAILCLATDFLDLRNRLENMCVAYSYDNKPIYISDLGCVGSMMVLLKDAIKPNLVQTLEGNPAIIHGGPFANIAHGCNSVISTKMGMSLADYVVIEAGFGADLGAQKFFDIVSKNSNIKPAMVVINVTLKSLKYNGGSSKEDVNNINIESLLKGIENLDVHIDNMKNYIDNCLVCLNKFSTDTNEEIDILIDYCCKKNVKFAVNDSYTLGSNGALGFAKNVIDMCNNNAQVNYLYSNDLSIVDKINKVCTNIYRASNVIYSDIAREKINFLESLGYSDFDVCIAKTQYSLSDNPKLIGNTDGYDMHVTDISLNSGAKFIVVYMGNIIAMPGLGKGSNYLNIDIDNSFKISNLS